MCQLKMVSKRVVTNRSLTDVLSQFDFSEIAIREAKTVTKISGKTTI